MRSRVLGLRVRVRGLASRVVGELKGRMRSYGFGRELRI